MDNKIQQSQDDLKKHLEEQLLFLESSIKSYDAGNKIEAKRMAVVIRTLLHETKNSKSLLGQLGLLNIKFIDTSKDYDPAVQ